MFEFFNADEDLLMIMLGTLTFLGTRTHIRFRYNFCVAVNCFLAYLLSSLLLGTPPRGVRTRGAPRPTERHSEPRAHASGSEASQRCRG